MSSKSIVLEAIHSIEEKRFSTFDINSKCPDVFPRDVSTALATIAKDGVIKVVAKRKVKPFPKSLHKNVINVYELC